MGMYTAFHIGADLGRNPDPEVHLILQYMVREVDPPEEEELPNHPFFKTDRWRHLFTMDSAYFRADTHCSYLQDSVNRTWHLTVISNLKNYDGEIEKFMDWIMPHIDAIEGDVLGYSRYENAQELTTLRADNRCKYQYTSCSIL